MPRKKSEFKLLTKERLLKVNPERKSVSGNESVFDNLLSKALKQLPFDKKKK